MRINVPNITVVSPDKMRCIVQLNYLCVEYYLHKSFILLVMDGKPVFKKNDSNSVMYSENLH